MTKNERVREIRKVKGLTMRQFGEKIGVVSSTICDIENGRRNLNRRNLLAICREFRVNEDWLRTGEGEMFVEPDDDEDITRFMGDVLSDQPDFRRRLVSVPARMTQDEWELLEAKIRELAADAGRRYRREK